MQESPEESIVGGYLVAIGIDHPSYYNSQVADSGEDRGKNACDHDNYESDQVPLLEVLVASHALVKVNPVLVDQLLGHAALADIRVPSSLDLASKGLFVLTAKMFLHKFLWKVPMALKADHHTNH